MKQVTKTARFTGGPLNGTSKEVESHLTRYKHEQPSRPEDMREGEIPIGFFPPFHEYIYEEQPAGSGHFIYIESKKH